VTAADQDGLKMGGDPLAAGRLQGADQPIALRISFLRFLHNVVVEVLVKWGL
jgi:hypothetical protein